MVKLTEEIQSLMQSPAYINTNHTNHEDVCKKVDAYFKINFHGDTTAFKWISDKGANVCEKCKSMDGVIKKSIEDFDITTPLHPNCHCEIIEIGIDSEDLAKLLQSQETLTRIDEAKNTDLVKKKAEEKKQKELRVELFINRLLQPGNEGVGYSIVDQPTNSGITQQILNAYVNKHPEKHLSVDLTKLNIDVIKDIYKEFFYYDKKVDKITNDRIAYAIFDMGVMTSPENVALVVQNSLNEYGLNIEVDKIIGKNTISSLNKIDNVEKFMNILIENRINFLNARKDKNQWKGWFPRTRRYKNYNF